MRLASITMARNEASLIEPFCDQILHFFDYPIVIDHSSTDSTEDRLANRLPETNILRLASLGYPQSEIATILSRAIFSNLDADFVFFLDCDEFLPFASRSRLVDALARVDPSHTPFFQWRNVSPLKLDGTDIFRNFLLKASQKSPYRKIVASRTAIEDHPFRIEQGYHSISGLPERAKMSELSPEGLLHIPIQSRRKFHQKIKRSSEQIKTDEYLLRNRLGVHWIELLDVASAEATDEQLRLLALAYPDRSATSVGYQPLTFSFPYIQAGYHESTNDFIAALDSTPPGDAPTSPRDFVLRAFQGPVAYDSRDNSHDGLARILTRLIPQTRGDEYMAEDSGIPYEDLIAPLFSLPQKMPSTAWYGHIPFLFVLMGILRPNRYVELGVHYGSSLIAACTAAKLNPNGCETIGIDTWLGDEHAGTYDGTEIYMSLRRYLDANFRNHKLLRMTFDEGLGHIEDGSVDLLHIDGLHTYEAVKHDYESWQRKLTKDAVVLFHDTMVFDRGFGVHELWKEIAGPQNSINFPHCFGLGVLFTNPQAARIRSILPLLLDGALRDFYFRLCADIGETLPFRMGFAERLTYKTPEVVTSTSVRRSAHDLAVALRASARARLSQLRLRGT